MTKRINKEGLAVIAIDFQEKLMPAIDDNEALEKTVCKFLEGARVLELPIIVTQQYTKGLGDSTDRIKAALGDFQYIDKKSFSAFGQPEFEEKLKELGTKSVIMAGVEAHICVEQTVLDFLDRGYNVFLLADCIGSRRQLDKETAVSRMVQAGAVSVTYEAALYELLGEASGEKFKAVSKIVK